MDGVLVVNSGSSSLKFAVFGLASTGVDTPLLLRGHLALSGEETEFVVRDAHGTPLETSRHPSAGRFDREAALDVMLRWFLVRLADLRVRAVGHRVVHGGTRHSRPVRVTPDVLSYLEGLVPLAPLHQPYNLHGIRLIAAKWKNVPQVACFDTAFHATQSAVARMFALPRPITEAGVRRYGFHGLSYEYVASQLPAVLDEGARGKVIVAHLGNGASLCAMAHGTSVASTMGFSALDGLPMGTRCGALDPGVVLYLIQQRAMSTEDVVDLLYNRSGLLGVSGVSGDMRSLLDSDDPHAAEAIDLFVHRIVCEIGALAASLGGLDALIFTGGIGEHAAAIRARVCHGCAWLGARIDDAANRRGAPVLHARASALRIAIVPTDEERMIAAHTLREIAAGRLPS